MKRIGILFFVSLLFSYQAYTQQFATFGELSNDDIAMKQYSFDPEAEAVVLLHEAFADYDDAYHLVTKHHVRVKILKERGLSNADVTIRFWRSNDFERVTVQNAVTYNYDADAHLTTSNVARKSIFNKVINERIGETVFSFPNAQVGSILEYEYTNDMKNYNGLEDWNFQEERPVIASKFSLRIIPNAEFTYRVSKRLNMEVAVKPLEGGIHFEMHNIPGLRDEAYMDARADYLQKVVFQLSGYNRGDGFGGSKYMTSWDEVAKEMSNNSSFGGVLNKKVLGTELFLKEVLLASGEAAKMKMVYQYVRTNMTWSKMFSRFAPDGIKDAWQKKTGTSAELNFILMILLKEAGLQVNPALVSHRWHGSVNTDYPFVDQFSSVIACVNIGATQYFLDATEKHTPVNILPNDLLNTKALVINKRKGTIVNMENDTLAFREVIQNALIVAEDGAVSGSTLVNSSDYARIEKVEEYAAGRSDFLKQHFTNPSIKIDVKNFEVQALEKDSLPFLQKCTFNTALNASGTYYMIPLNLFSGFSANPFSSKERFSNINFGYKRSVTCVTNIVLPAGFVVEDLPKSIKLTNPEKDISLTRTTQYNKIDHSIGCSIVIDFQKSLYKAEDYDILRQMYIKMMEMIVEPVLIKKK